MDTTGYMQRFTNPNLHISLKMAQNETAAAPTEKSSLLFVEVQKGALWEK